MNETAPDRGQGAPSAPGTTDVPLLIVYGDYACPFCFLAEVELKRLRAAVGIDMVHRAFELRPVGLPLPDPTSLKRVWTGTVAPVAAALGVELRQPGISTRTRKAHEAAAFARTQGRFPEMHEAIFQAYFREGRDIGRIDVLVELGATLGLDRTELKVALDIDKYTEQVLAEAEAGTRDGIRGVPAYVTEDGESPSRMLTGLHDHETLASWIFRTEETRTR